jgi:hypothetical protein
MSSFSKPLAFGLLAIACILAAAGGGYLGTRYHALPGAKADTPTSPAARQAAQPQPVASGAAATAAAQPAPSTPAVTGQVTEARPVASTRLAAPVRPARPSHESMAKPAGAPGRQTQVPPAPIEPVEPPSGFDAVPPQAAAPPPPAAAAVPVQPETPAPPAAEIPLPPPEKVFDQLVVPADSVLGLRLESTISSNRARVEDRVDARVTRSVTVGDRVAIPAGSHLEGTVTLVERGGKVRERGRLGIRFNTLVLADGTRTPINTETVYREGESVAGKTAAKITGATAGGAFLGALLGGGKGAAIGGAVGAAGGTAAVMAGNELVVTLPAGALLTVRLLGPVTVEVER